MQSTYGLLENAKSGLIASQLALDITSQNVSNSTTPGYTRQVLEQYSKPSTTGEYRFASNSPQVGNGVDVAGVSQIRDPFLDTRYRYQNTDYNTWSSQQSALSQLEDIFEEFTTTSSTTNTSSQAATDVGLGGKVSDIVQALLEYQNSPDDANIPNDIKNDFDLLCQTIRSDQTQLDQLMKNEKTDLGAIINGGNGSTSGGVNAMLDQVKSLNEQISTYELSGQKANDLRDQRNVLLDKLSGIMDIQATEQTNGMVTISLQNDNTKMLIDGQNQVNHLSLNADSTEVDWSDGTKANIKGGEVFGYLSIINGTGSGNSTDAYPDLGIPYMTAKLNSFAKQFADAVNNLASTEETISPTVPLLTYNASDPSSSIDLSDNWKNDKALFKDMYTGSNRGQMISSFENLLKNDTGKISGYNGTIQDYADTFSSDVAFRLNSVETSESQSQTTLSNLDKQRQSISSVSIDDEGINIIRYQQSYNASARVITTIDQMLDKLINGTGIVGISG